MENAYAQALWTVIEKGMNQADAVRALHAKLKREGREALLPRIASAFSRLARAEGNSETIMLTVADKTHEHAARKDALAASPRPGLDGKDLEIRVDPTLIGGWRLEGREELIDASYKKYLLEMYNRAVGAASSDS